RGGAGREVLEHLAAVAVGGADLDLVEAVEDVELGEGDPGNAGDLDRLPHHDGVEPAAATLAPGDDAELAAALAQALADRIGELGREGAAADPRRVRLGDAEHVSDGAGTDARARCRLARHRVRRCDIRVGAVVDVEHRSLRALEKDAPASAPRFVEAL